MDIFSITSKTLKGLCIMEVSSKDFQHFDKFLNQVDKNMQEQSCEAGVS